MSGREWSAVMLRSKNAAVNLNLLLLYHYSCRWNKLNIAHKIYETNIMCCIQLSYHFLQFSELFTLTIDALFLKLDKIL